MLPNVDGAGDGGQSKPEAPWPLHAPPKANVVRALVSHQREAEEAAAELETGSAFDWPRSLKGSPNPLRPGSAPPGAGRFCSFDLRPSSDFLCSVIRIF